MVPLNHEILLGGVVNCDLRELSVEIQVIPRIKAAIAAIINPNRQAYQVDRS